MIQESLREVTCPEWEATVLALGKRKNLSVFVHTLVFFSNGHFFEFFYSFFETRSPLSNTGAVPGSNMGTYQAVHLNPSTDQSRVKGQPAVSDFFFSF